ncbi:MAG TPA: hypothetical protein VHR66_02250 [Gemmataceae bacterium]|jgi:hypothetical protein|nr:hypothetical protein [Gemmataceae bacterium]
MVENLLDVGGAVVFWSLAEWSDRQRLLAHFAPLDLAALVPEPRPAPACLRSALEEVLAGPRVLIRPLASRDGFAVVKEDRGLAANRYQTELTARVHGNPPALTFDPWDARATRIDDAYQTQLGRVPATQLSAALVRVVESLGGTRLRPSGAVYWIPGPRLDDWVNVVRAIERAADGRPSSVYVLRHRMDRDAVRAIRDAVVAEVQSEATRICSDVVAGDLGTRDLEARKKQAADLRAKVLLYEELLAVGLQGLHTAVDEADQAAATAALMLGSAASEPHVVHAG